MGSIHLVTPVAAPVGRVFDVARDIDLHMQSMAHTGERAIGGRTSGLIGLGGTVTWEARHLGRTWNLTSRIVVYEPPTRFVDEQVSGPFRSFRHEHRFAPADVGTLMIDDWLHVAPFGPLGLLADWWVLDGYLRGLLQTRNELLRRVAEGAG